MVQPELQQLLDERAIQAVVHRYARGVDRRDWELVRSCYHPDAIDDRGPGRYTGGVDGFLEWVAEKVAGYASTSHHIATQNIELDGDSAWVESYCLALHRSEAEDGAVDRLVPCRYFDRFERRDGEWRIAERTNVYDPGRADPVVVDVPPLGIPGRPGREDPTYRRVPHELAGGGAGAD